jgi:hypothetical protein
MNRRGLTLCLFIFQAVASLGLAQTPPAAATPNPPTSSSWQQLEATYQNELKKIHIPLLSSYINELTRLAAQSHSAEATVAINRELKEMQAVITAGGVVDLSRPLGTQETQAASNTPSAPSPKNDSLLALSPGTAKTITPAPNPPTPPTVTVQKISWLIAALPAGKYEVICQGAVTALETPANLTLQIGDQLLKFPLAKRHVATDSNNLRLIRIGTIDLPTDATQLPLDLAIDSQASNLILRQLLFTRAATPKTPTPP